ncbi:Dyp-type peroxidase [Exidia glandulosa HHB12029]|uniref:Dyp-type peroxidase n=1 Tax=Exidia glandulosa HHB12029 TaxID=1314781 RepID=A0A165G2C1_EXIGL|nr:Dyp-type peroxidase [Exidia glandulosa HHB12029]
MRSLLSFAILAAASVHQAVGQTTIRPPSQDAVAAARLQLSGARTTNILKDIPGLIPYPTVVADASNSSGLPLDNIQGDILVGMKKHEQQFLFFSINNPKSFKLKLRTLVAPFITSAKQLMNVKTQPIVALNLAFSQTGLTTLNVTDDLGDAVFTKGQFADATNLGDPGTDNWKPAFKGTSVHGVFLMASDSKALIDVMELFLVGIFLKDITVQHTLLGNVRPGSEAGHEMFGWLDGIAQPSIPAFQAPFPGQQVVDPGVILVGETGDPVTRPAWAKDGSFLAFRQLQQLVPEFHGFLNASAPAVPGLTQPQSADLLGARMVGRWKSGAPIDNFPTADAPGVGADPMQNNNFNFAHDGFDITTDQSHCPFDAHIRKTRPRADLVAPANSIMRSGIPYGPEVTSAELVSGKSDPSDSKNERGLAFVAYQAQLAKGFQFLQHSWANNPNFVFGKNVKPGHDPIIGANGGLPRNMSGFDIADTTQSLQLPADWIRSRGGEYFFSPSISAIKTVIAV